jgi:hypothetical protein
VREQCMALPEVTEGLTHGAPTWFLRGRRMVIDAAACGRW